MLNRRTVITFEKLERSSYRLPDSEPVLARCDVCRQEVSWLTPNQVVALTGLTLRQIFRRIEAKAIHFNETPPGLLHICPNSLSSLGDVLMPTDLPAKRMQFLRS